MAGKVTEVFKIIKSLPSYCDTQTGWLTQEEVEAADASLERAARLLAEELVANG